MHRARAHSSKTFSPRRIASDSVLPLESAVQRTPEHDMENDREMAELMIGATSAVVEACGGSAGQLTLPSSTISTSVGNLLLTAGWEKRRRRGGGEETEERTDV